MYRVALVTITRDDARCVERALLSARPHVDELLVLDLGSVDDTVVRARGAGARVESTPWHPDPSLIRNAALARTDAHWHVILEAGEWIAAGGPALGELRERAPDEVGLAETVPVGAQDALAPTALEPRILPGPVRYAGLSREDAIYPGRRTWRPGVVVARDERASCRWRADRVRAEAALAQALAIGPQDPRLLAQLGENLRDQGRASAAADVYAQALIEAGEQEPCRHQLVVELLDALRDAGRFAEAIRLMDAEMPRWPDSPDFAYVVGSLFFQILLAQPANATYLAPLAEASWRRCLDIGDRTGLAGTLTGRGSFLAAGSLATLHRRLGNEQRAQQWWGRADALRPGRGPVHRG